MIKAMLGIFQAWRRQSSCEHRYRYSRSRPGTLVCKDCRKRKKPEPQIFH